MPLGSHEWIEQGRYIHHMSGYCIQDTLSSRALGLAALGRVLRASKGILHTRADRTGIYFV